LSLPEALLTVAFGLFTGVLSGLLGVGGGIVMVPYLVLALGQGQHLAEGTSLLVIVPTAIAGAWTHSRRGLVVPRVAVGLGLGGVAGALGGAQLALLLPTDVLTRVFAGFLFVMGARFVLQRPPPGARRPEAEKDGATGEAAPSSD
jgi:uncharacterized membrane protein YfcA